MWNSRLFEFGAVLFLADIFPGTLLPMSVYALVRGFAAVLFAQTVGSWVDKGNRLHVVRASIIGQRASVIASCLVLWAMETRDLSEKAKTGLFGVSVILSCVEKLMAVMNTVAVERDWVVVMTEDNTYARRLLNARMRRIDLICKLVGPLVISNVAIASTVIAIYTTLAMSAVSVPIEYICIEQVFRFFPALAQRNIPLESNEEPRSLWKRLTYRVLPISSLPFYFRHPAFIPSFSLALLYLTVLSFSGQMITWLLAVGYTTTYVGVARTVSTVLELSATWIAPRLSKKIGAVRCGIWSLSWQMITLTAGVAWYYADFFSTGKPHLIAATGLTLFVALSRVGLWGFDLSAQLIVQEEVEESHRGTFSTVEAAFQNLAEMTSYALTIAFSRPDQFQWPILPSIAAVYVSGGLYTWFVRKRRGHLLHLSCIMGEKGSSRPESVELGHRAA
ncbi:Ferroporti-1 [Emericellopsis atlantica]|uniref:Solute carrier family 40 member n=1 Tax=Emericellopsis atlantica TaxID=2614577 RepID=A0A9P7ZJB7_9HYPO|nr:Ferroporti-1 [Emericellopsis atlantica]KAG9252817.1 Ferroporti-1 [Emericellopsis atlantica]